MRTPHSEKCVPFGDVIFPISIQSFSCWYTRLPLHTPSPCVLPVLPLFPSSLFSSSTEYLERPLLCLLEGVGFGSTQPLAVFLLPLAQSTGLQALTLRVVLTSVGAALGIVHHHEEGRPRGKVFLPLLGPTGTLEP